MPTLEDIRARFTDQERNEWEIDRILVQELDEADPSRTRIAIDLRAGYSSMNIQMGAGCQGFVGPRYGKRTPLMEVLGALSAKLEGVPVERADLWGCRLRNEGLLTLLEMPWFQDVKLLNLGDNGLTKKGLDALFSSPVGRQLRRLCLAYNRVGGAIKGISGMEELDDLVLTYTNISGKALAKLGKAKLPSLTRLGLQAVTGSTTPEKLIMASKMGDPVKPVTIAPADLAAFLASPLAASLEWLALDNITLDPACAAAIGEAELPALNTLSLASTELGLAGLTALAGGQGLVALEELLLQGAVALHSQFDGTPNEPDAEYEAAFRALGQAGFARHLRSVILDTNAVGAPGVAGLLAGDLPALTDLGLAQTKLGDDGCRALVAARCPLTRLRLMGNRIGAAGIAALLEAPFAGRLIQLALHHNPIGDKGCSLLAKSERLGSMQRLALGGTGATDQTVEALVQGPVLGGLVLLNLFDNRISDQGALLLAQAKPAALEVLSMSRCGLTARGVEAISALPLKRVHLAEQDPNKLPPRFEGAPALVFEPLAQSPAKARTTPTPRKIASMYTSPNWVGISAHPGWALALIRKGSGYRTELVEVATRRVVKPDPPVQSSFFYFEFSPDGRWCALLGRYDGAFVVDTQTGASTRLGDCFRHQKGGIDWCGDRVVVLDCDTSSDWQGRLEVYAHDDERGWRREHQVSGFYTARDTLTPIADGRILAIGGSQGAFFVAVRGDQLRYLGQIPGRTVIPYQVGDRSYLAVQGHGYELTNIDQALDQAFAEGEQVTSIDLPKSSWPR